MVARERFELSSEAPEAPMLGHYTTGLKLRASNLPKNKIAQKNILFLFVEYPFTCVFFCF